MRTYADTISGGSWGGFGDGPGDGVAGGVLKVLPKTSSGESVVFQQPEGQLRPGHHLAGRDATGGTVTVTPEAAFGTLAAVIAKLQEVRSGLQGETVGTALQAGAGQGRMLGAELRGFVAAARADHARNPIRRNERV